MQLSAISLALTRIYGGGVAPFTPASLFANSEVGAWYDPSDLTTMFQDRAGTTPVTADGQTVGKILDKSGRDNHAVAPSDAARPLYKTDGTYHWLLGDGVDDRLVSPNIDFSAYPNLTVWSGISATAPSAASVHTVFSLGPQVYSENGSFAWFVGEANNRENVLLRGTQVTSQVSLYNNSAGKNLTRIKFDLSQLSGNDEVSIVENGGAVSNWSLSDNANAGTGTFGNLPFALFANTVGTYLFAGKNYGVILRAGATVSEDATNADRWMLNKLGGLSAIAIGDSITSFYSGLVSVFWGISSVQSREVLLAASGNTIAQQATAFANYPFKDNAAWVGIQCGINDLDYTEAASVAIGRLQNLVNQVRAGIPAAAKIMICQMTPCKTRLINLYGATNGAIAYQKWLDINTAIAGGGATPITGTDVIATAHVAALNDGAGNLAGAYDYGDGVHPNNAGRQLISDSWVAALGTIGVTP